MSTPTRTGRSPSMCGGGLLQPDVDRLLQLAERAAAVGVERFVLDDGWFGAAVTIAPGLAIGPFPRTSGPTVCTPS